MEMTTVFAFGSTPLPIIFPPMQCLYCRPPLTETSKECPSCQLSLQSANALLGAIPRYDKGLTDSLRVLGKGSNKKNPPCHSEFDPTLPTSGNTCAAAKIRPPIPNRNPSLLAIQPRRILCQRPKRRQKQLHFTGPRPEAGTDRINR